MTANTITAAGALARLLAEIKDVEERDIALAEVVCILADASESDAYSALHDCAADVVAQAHVNIADGCDGCECPWEHVTPTMISPPERLVGRNPYCPVHGRDPG